jgi:uncharacterized protein DUF1569
MDTLFDPAACERILRRIDTLRPDSSGQWGKMKVAQMLAHCSIALEAATGDGPMKQIFLGKLLTPFVRKAFVGPKPYARNSPTGPTLIVRDERDFATERRRLVADIQKLVAGGPAAAAKHPHGFIGRVTGEEWGQLHHKHLDHHLTQFGS